MSDTTSPEQGVGLHDFYGSFQLYDSTKRGSGYQQDNSKILNRIAPTLRLEMGETTKGRSGLKMGWLSGPLHFIFGALLWREGGGFSHLGVGLVDVFPLLCSIYL